jgi:predicted regulator of Ras-like GTPase activity (Roadblock/LC7/MglB family)
VRLVAVQGSVVASTDGMIIAHDLAETNAYGVEPETLAALAAANLGLSQRIADTASHGELRAAVISSAFGHVATYAAGEYALLAVLARAEARVDALHAEAYRVAGRVAALVDSSPPPPVWG